VTSGKWQVTRKTKMVGRESSRAETAVPSTLNAQPSTVVLPHAHPVATPHFTLREDGSIGTPSTASARSGSNAQHAEPVLGAPTPSTLNPQPSTQVAPRLAFSDSARGIWLYHGNCLELLDAIAAKYPDGRFDAIFADPPAWT